MLNHDMNIKAALLVAGFACFTGCSQKPKEQDVTGQAFIVLKNRETVKLSMMDLMVISEVEATKRLAISDVCQAKVKEFEKLKRQVERDIESLDGRIQKAQADYDSFSKLADEWVELGHRSESAETGKSVVRGLEKCTTAMTADAKESAHLKPLKNTVEEKLKQVTKDISFWNGPAPYFLPPIQSWIAKTTTDADGKFSLKVPVGKALYLAAYAERQSPAGTEMEGWIVPVSQTLMLNNNNAIPSP